MQRPLFYLAAAALLWHGLSTHGQAQLIQIRPGYIRAPFVRVYTNPDGSSHVRAPFVNVNSPGSAGPQYVAPGSPMAVNEPASEMDGQSLNFAALESVARLEVDLHALPTGDFWRSHLKINEVNRILANDAASDFAARRQELEGIVAIYDATSESAEMQQIAGLPSFQAVHVALRELQTHPEQRLRRQLNSAYQQLNASLEGYASAVNWREYLAVPPAFVTPVPEAGAPSMGDLAVVLSRYASVSRSIHYREIAQFAGFEMTHRRLAEYYQMLDPPFPAASAAELLPPPVPAP